MVRVLISRPSGVILWTSIVDQKPSRQGKWAEVTIVTGQSWMFRPGDFQRERRPFAGVLLYQSFYPQLRIAQLPLLTSIFCVRFAENALKQVKIPFLEGILLKNRHSL